MRQLFAGLLALVILHSVSLAQPFDPSIEAAHKAYLECDGNGLLKNIKEALIRHENHPVIVRNLMELFRAAQKNQILDGVQFDWQVPPELKKLRVGVRRKDLPQQRKTIFNFLLSAVMQSEKSIEQLQVIRYPNTVIFDKAAKVGEWGTGMWEKDVGFWASGERTPIEVEEGLYLINIQMSNRPMVKGWFLLASQNSSGVPVIESPKLGELTTTHYPIIKWQEFHSPEWQSGESSRVTVRFIKETENSYLEIIRASFSAKRTSFQVGNRSGARVYSGAQKLESGRSLLDLEYDESRLFGDFRISRVSSTRMPIQIQ